MSDAILRLTVWIILAGQLGPTQLFSWKIQNIIAEAIA